MPRPIWPRCQLALSLIRRHPSTRAETGLRVEARLLGKVYHIGRKCSETFRDLKDRFMRHDAALGHWNYLTDARGVS